MNVKIYWRNMAAALAVLAAVSGIGVAAAYLTDYPRQLHNTFTVGTAVVEVLEPSWDAQEGRAVTAGRRILKDPSVTNTGTVNVYPFLEVKIPRRVVRVVDENDRFTVYDAEPTDLFTFTANEKWTLMEEGSSDDWHVYLYGYDEVLPPGKTTENPLFRQVVYANVINGELKKDETFSIPLHVVAIQADFLQGISDADSFQEKQRKAYELYVRQITSGEEVLP